MQPAVAAFLLVTVTTLIGGWLFAMLMEYLFPDGSWRWSKDRGK